MNKSAAPFRWFKPLPFALGLSVAIAGVFAYKALTPPVHPMAERAAQFYGVNARNYERVVNLMDKGKQVALTVDDYGFIVQQTKDKNPVMRLAGFDALKWAAEKGPYRDQALSVMTAMRNDPDSKIRKEYVWAMMIARAPQWETVCRQALEDPDPDVRAKAERALLAGAHR